MSDLYSELLVTRKTSPKDVLAKTAMIVLTVLVVLAALLTFNTIIMIVALAVCVADYFLFPRFNVEFEYLHVNDEIDVDKIFSKSKRKRAMNIDLGKMEIMAPLGSHHLDSYQNQKLKTVDFSANDGEKRPYVMITSTEKEMVRILLQLDYDMFQNIKRRRPRIVFDD